MITNRQLRRQRLLLGFTLVELLVVIVVVGTLILLIFPVLQSGREAAQRTKCSSNLRQIGIGLSNYLSRNRSYPVGCVDCHWSNPNRKQNSWITAILSDLEYDHVLAGFDLRNSYKSLVNRAAAGNVLPIFLCPSTYVTNRDGFTTGDVNGNGSWDPGDDLAYTDYGGIYGIEGPPYNPPMGSQHFVSDNALGVMVHEIRTKLPMIRDGISATAIVGECTGRGGGSNEQSEWANGQNVFAKYYTTPINRSQNNELWSDHPGGAQLLFCDGHVSFFSEDVHQEVVNAALTRAGSDHPSIP